MLPHAALAHTCLCFFRAPLIKESPNPSWPKHTTENILTKSGSIAFPRKKTTKKCFEASPFLPIFLMAYGVRKHTHYPSQAVLKNQKPAVSTGASHSEQGPIKHRSPKRNKQQRAPHLLPACICTGLWADQRFEDARDVTQRWKWQRADRAPHETHYPHARVQSADRAPHDARCQYPPLWNGICSIYTGRNELVQNEPGALLLTPDAGCLGAWACTPVMAVDGSACAG
jgi:hypothetical protein